MLVVNRIPETLGYNILYFGIGLGVVEKSVADFSGKAFAMLSILFTAVMLTKMQASIADTIHDQTVDKENPEKSHLASAVHWLGTDRLWSLLVVEATAGMALWGWLSMRYGTPVFLISGAVSTIIGFIYSYPPRVKERGVFNHISTTAVDVLCVIFPVTVLLSAQDTSLAHPAFIIVFLYAFGYHVLHQAADTYYDRQSGVSTLTQSLGVENSVWLSCIVTILAAIIAAVEGYVIGSLVIAIFGVAYGILAIIIRGIPEQNQVT